MLGLVFQFISQQEYTIHPRKERKIRFSPHKATTIRYGVCLVCSSSLFPSKNIPPKERKNNQNWVFSPQCIKHHQYMVYAWSVQSLVSQLEYYTQEKKEKSDFSPTISIWCMLGLFILIFQFISQQEYSTQGEIITRIFPNKFTTIGTWCMLGLVFQFISQQEYSTQEKKE